MSQATFDIDALILEAEREAAPAWTGAPLHYHEEPYRPEELDAAFERWKFEHGNFGCIPKSHMWHRSMFNQPTIQEGVHSLAVFTASTFCEEPEHTHDLLPTPGRVQGICTECDWRLIDPDESLVVEAWHDHAFPGWRELPVVPRKYTGLPPRGRDPLREWAEEHYPATWQRTGAPIITEREGIGTRHVPGRSPWGGFDLSDSAIKRL